MHSHPCTSCMGTTLANSSTLHLSGFLTDFLQMKTTSGGLSTRQKSVRMTEEKHKQCCSCPGLDKRSQHCNLCPCTEMGRQKAYSTKRGLQRCCQIARCKQQLKTRAGLQCFMFSWNPADSKAVSESAFCNLPSASPPKPAAVCESLHHQCSPAGPMQSSPAVLGLPLCIFLAADPPVGTPLSSLPHSSGLFWFK